MQLYADSTYNYTNIYFAYNFNWHYTTDKYDTAQGTDKPRGMVKHPWALTQDTTVLYYYAQWPIICVVLYYST